MARICFIDQDADNMLPPFLQNAWEQLGHDTQVVFASVSRSDLKRQLEDSQPDLLVAFQNVGFRFADLLCDGPLAGVKKAILCYDEPVQTCWLFGRRHPFVSSPAEWGVHFFIWDGYWRKKMGEEWKWSVHATHLAAESKYFSPGKSARYPELKDHGIFLGGIPSMDYLARIQSRLPKAHTKVAMLLWQEILSGSYGANPFSILERIIQERPEPERKEIQEQMETSMNGIFEVGQPLPPHVELRRLAWQMGKRETRLRAMKTASLVLPLAILSDLKAPGSAGEVELGEELKKRGGKEVKFVDTSSSTYYDLAHLYATGLVHLQSTDPQSVEGGIPYRVFQSAACGIPLVSDFKTELAECFKPEEEIWLYQGEGDLGETLSRALMNRDRLKEVGTAAHRRFMKEHMWVHRMKALLKEMGIGG